jgi:hypothetical protein
MLEFMGEFPLKVSIAAIALVLYAQILQGRDQRFRDKDTAVRTKVTVTIRKIIDFH